MNRFSSNADKTMSQRPNGSGVPMRWECLGCREKRDLTGSRGIGIKKRCAACVAKKAALDAMADNAALLGLDY